MVRRRTKRFAVIATVLAVTLLLAGCGVTRATTRPVCTGCG